MKNALLILYLGTAALLGQGITLLSLTGPTMAGPGSTITLNVIGGGVSPAATQFTINLPTGVSRVSVSAGGVATTAGKTVQCSAFAMNKVTCVVSGLNQNVMVAGVQAVVHVAFSSAVTLGPKVFSISEMAASAAGLNLPVGTPLVITVAASGALKE